MVLCIIVTKKPKLNWLEVRGQNSEVEMSHLRHFKHICLSQDQFVSNLYHYSDQWDIVADTFNNNVIFHILIFLSAEQTIKISSIFILNYKTAEF